ncbi:MAG: phosphoglucosamine mutase [Deltaproteobacteria bacterium]|nr:phosphoglucosamine mutase [Deltaproteobacteria bacterium]
MAIKFDAPAKARRLFGTDGVRGVANVWPMTTEVAMQLGRAVAHLMRNGSHRHRVVIGKDTRLSGYMLEQALAAGICSMGVDVMLVGPLPTPGIAFITQSMRADAGAVISASHNPYQDNGIKFFSRDGFKLPDEVEMKIEELIASSSLDAMRPTATKIGKAYRIEDAQGRYIVFLKNTFPKELTLDGLTIVVDCAHGASYKVAPAVFEELGAKVIRLGVAPDGKNINAKVGALHPEHMAKAVQKHGADLGIAMDGDADRVIVCDEKGNIVDGDAIMAICARELTERKALAKRTLVATVMSNMGLDKAMAGIGVKVVRTRVGDRYVVEEMRRSGFNFGGEQSGHLIFLDHATTGDGAIAALNLLAVMVKSGKPLSELARFLTLFPQTQLNIAVKEKRELGELPTVVKAIRSVEGALGKDGRVLVRFSGTEAKARVLVEGPDARRNQGYADQIAGELKKALG